MSTEYLAEKDLGNLSLTLLTAKVTLLKADLNNYRQAFLAKKDSLMQAIQIPVNWFLKRNTPNSRLRETVEWLLPKLNATTDIWAFDATFTECIKIISVEEQTHYAAELSLTTRLKKLHTELCWSGFLPRPFSVHVKPLILVALVEARRIFTARTSRLLNSHTRAQSTLLNLLEQTLHNALTEQEAAQGLANAIEAAQTLIQQRKSKFSLSTYYWQTGLGLETNVILLNVIVTLKNELKIKGCLSSPFTFDIDFIGLQNAIQTIEQHIRSRQEHFKAQKNKLVQEHTNAFSMVENCKFYLPQIIYDFIVTQEKLLNNLPALQVQNEKTALLNLRHKYMDFWHKLANSVAKKVYANDNQLRTAWFTLHANVLEARKQLQNRGHLIYDFSQDKRHEIVLQFDIAMSKAKKNNILQRGKMRQTQLDELRQELCTCHSTTEAVTVLWNKIHTIEEDHAAHSFLYNFVPLRKLSRTATALRSFAEYCGQHQLLPPTQEVIVTPLTSVVESFRDAIDAYFDKDILFSNRTYRYHSKKLLQKLRAIDARLRQRSINFIVAQNMMAECIEETIQEVSTAEQPHGTITCFTKFLGKTSTAFSQTLRDTKNHLQNIEKKLCPSYKHAILPRIKQSFEAALKAYKIESRASKNPVVSVQKSTFGRIAEIFTNTLNPGNPPDLEDRTEGLRQGRELMLSLFHDVCNSQQAAFILQNGIKSLKEVYPQLAVHITVSMQDLQKEGILPHLTVEEFGNYLRDKIKKEAELVANMQAGIKQLEKLTKSAKKTDNLACIPLASNALEQHPT